MEVYFVRHGHTDNIGGLSEKGKKEVQKVGEELTKTVEGKSFYILSSPTLRTIETSKIVSKTLNSSFSIDQRLHLVQEGISSIMENFWHLIREVDKKTKNSVNTILILVAHCEQAENCFGYPIETGEIVGFCPIEKEE